MVFQVIQGDITKMETGAIVNAAGTGLQMRGDVCSAIFQASGVSQMQEACDRYGYCSTGQAVITPGFNLPADYVIHTVGPVWHGGNHGEELLLYDCYRNSLKLAASHGAKSIAFPLISAGRSRFPKEMAMKVASFSIREFQKNAETDMDAYLVLYDWDSVQTGRRLFPDKWISTEKKSS